MADGLGNRNQWPAASERNIGVVREQRVGKAAEGGAKSAERTQFGLALNSIDLNNLASMNQGFLMSNEPNFVAGGESKMASDEGASEEWQVTRGSSSGAPGERTEGARKAPNEANLILPVCFAHSGVKGD